MLFTSYPRMTMRLSRMRCTTRPSPIEQKNEIELPQKLLAQEKGMIEAALKETRGSVFGPRGAAAKLGIPRSTLEWKIRSLKIDKNRFKIDVET